MLLVALVKNWDNRTGSTADSSNRAGSSADSSNRAGSAGSVVEAVCAQVETTEDSLKDYVNRALDSRIGTSLEGDPDAVIARLQAQIVAVKAMKAQDRKRKKEEEAAAKAAAKQQRAAKKVKR